MTKLQVFECLQNYPVITSSEMIYDSDSNINIPRYAVVEVIEASEKMYHYYHFNEKTGTFAVRAFTTDESLYINYLMNNRADLLLNMLNSGTLYKNVRRLIRKADSTVEHQAAVWAENSKEVQLTLKTKDETKYRRLLEGLYSAAQDEIYPAMLYV